MVGETFKLLFIGGFTCKGVKGQSPFTERVAGSAEVAKRRRGSEWMQPLAAGIQSRGVTEPQRDRPGAPRRAR